MDTLQFASEVIRSLAWPIAACVIAFALRGEIAGLLRRLSSLKHKETEFTFSQKVDRAKEVLEAKTPTAISAPAPQISDTESRMLRLIEVSPSAGLVEAWTMLEAALRRAAKQVGFKYEQRGPIPLPGVLSALRGANKIDDEDEKIITQMRGWRNWAVHSEGREQVDAATAWKYASMCLQLIKEIES